MSIRIVCSLAFFLASFALSAAEAWPQFRGPTGDGHSAAQGLPLTWSESENVKWKTPIHGRGWSSPVVWGNQIWLTTSTEDGRELSAVCVEATSGRIVHDLKLFHVENPQFAHKFNSYASPTPVIEAGRVYVTFGSPGTACLDAQTGKVLWERRDLECNHFRGAGSSPVLHGNLLIMNHDGSDFQYVVALDKATGKTVWRTERSIDFQDLGADGKPQAEGDFRKAFATPHVATVNGKEVLFSSGAKAHYAYDPMTGKELWRLEERGQHSASTRPVVGEGIVYMPSGFAKGQLLAVKLGGSGVLGAADVVWRSTRSVPNKPSVTLVGDLLFTVDDSGIASCLEAKTGTEVWRERAGGNYSASPLFAEARIYVFNEEGKAVVFAVERTFKKLAENTLADGFMASPAVTGKALILRTKSALYRVEK